MRGEAERNTPNYNYPKLQLPQIYNNVCVIISWLLGSTAGVRRAAGRPPGMFGADGRGAGRWAGRAVRPAVR